MKKQITILCIVLISFFSTNNMFSQEGFIGEVRMFAGNFAPRNWAFCEGQLLSINSNQALFSILGTTYGGDGRTTFGLPDLRGRVSIHPGTGPGLPTYRLGQKGGLTNTILNLANLPSHKHDVKVNVNTTTGEEPNAINVIANHTGAFSEDPSPSQVLGGVTENSIGNNQSFTNLQPYLAINYIICLQGVYPSRN